MANNFRHDADVLVSVAAADALELTEPLKKHLRHAADVLYKLDKLKRELATSDPEDEDQCEQMAKELVSLLGLPRS